jgi:hypothetical protein
VVAAAAAKKRSKDDELADAIADFYDDPLGYVMFNWDWENDASIQMVELVEPWKSRYKLKYGPDKWACEFLEDLGREIKKRKFDGRSAVDPIQFTTASGHGIGKSVLVAWLIKFILDTRPFSKGTVTANTDVQLRTKTWATLGAWHKKSLTADWFDYSAGRGSMALRSKTHPEEWFATAQTCREENSESFAGQHAANATSFYIFDEASGVPDKIFEVRKGGLMTGEPMTFDFGNPTRNTGAFFENCEGKQKHRYKVRMIDARTVSITNKKEQQKLIDDYGIESDIVAVRVLGRFPKSGSTQFISTESVEEAMERKLPERNKESITLGVDVARFGDDDSVIYPRQGWDARSWPVTRLNGADTIQIAGKVIELVRYFKGLGIKVGAINVDGGGGYGGGVVDHLRALGYPVHEIQFGSKPHDKNTYRYRVDELWGKVREALTTRLCLPKAAEVGSIGADLKEQLTQRQYGIFQLGKINLESKDELKKRLGGSPDIADALALTYANEAAPADVQEGAYGAAAGHSDFDYDPLEGDV